MILYKLTDKNGLTQAGTQYETRWSPGFDVLPIGHGDRPCQPGVLHFYHTEIEALLFNPIHADLADPRLWRCEVASILGDDGLKRGTKGPVRVIEEIAVPEVSTRQRVAFAIVIAPHPRTQRWAIGWLDGSDRSAVAATAAWAAARAAWAAEEAAVAAEAAAAAAASAAAAVASAAAEAAEAEAVAVAAAKAAKAAEAEAWAAEEAAEAKAAEAEAAAWAAEAAAAKAEAAAEAAGKAAAAKAAEAALWEGVDGWQPAFHARVAAAWDRANAILDGSFPADRYDAPLLSDQP